MVKENSKPVAEPSPVKKPPRKSKASASHAVINVSDLSSKSSFDVTIDMPELSMPKLPSESITVASGSSSVSDKQDVSVFLRSMSYC